MKALQIFGVKDRSNDENGQPRSMNRDAKTAGLFYLIFIILFQQRTRF